MMRETSQYGMSSHVTQQARIVDNTRLSALTNQIMELVLDNIKMLHMNSKLIDYCKRQTIQAEYNIKTMETKVESSASH